MRLYIVKEIAADSENLMCHLSFFSTKSEALDKVKKLHERLLDDYKHYNSYEDSYEERDVWDDYRDGDECFNLVLEDDCDVRACVEIEERDMQCTIA